MKETILLVDDEQGIRTVMGLSLRDAGYNVITVASGEVIPHGLYILQILLNLRNPELRVVVTYCLFQPCPVECSNLFSEHCLGRHISVGMACHDKIIFTFMPSAFTFL